jgi:hypothetical protein
MSTYELWVRLPRKTLRLTYLVVGGDTGGVSVSDIIHAAIKTFIERYVWKGVDDPLFPKPVTKVRHRLARAQSIKAGTLRRRWADATYCWPLDVLTSLPVVAAIFVDVPVGHILRKAFTSGPFVHLQDFYPCIDESLHRGRLAVLVALAMI